MRYGRKKVFRVIALMLLVLMIINTLPIQALAQTVLLEQQREEQLRNALRKSVDESEYPYGLFEFLTTRMNTSKDLSFVEFAIVRKGGTKGEASVTLKAIDVTAEYGKDYTLSVAKDFFTHTTLPANEESRPLIDSIINSEGAHVNTVSEGVYYNSGEDNLGDKDKNNTDPETGDTDTSETDIYANTESMANYAENQASTVSKYVYDNGGKVDNKADSEDNLDDTESNKTHPEVIEADITVEFEELEMQPVSGKEESSSLKGAWEAFTGKESDRNSWREVDQETKKSALDLHQEIYEGIPGVTYTFNFEEGEYIKKIRFNTIDNNISADDKQVLFVLLDATGGVLGDARTAFMNIEDNGEKEKVEFEIAEDQISVDRDKGYAEVTVKRTSGLYRYGKISVGTAALTAQPEIDYKPVITELPFVPGQEEQAVRVPILGGGSDEEVRFVIKLDPGSPNLAPGGRTQTVVTINARTRYIMQSLEENPQKLFSASPQKMPYMGTETIDGTTYRYKLLTAYDLSPHYRHLYNIVNYRRINVPLFSKNELQFFSFNQDLTMVEKIRFDWHNFSHGTKYHPWWYVTPVYHKDYYSFLSFSWPYSYNFAMEKHGRFWSYDKYTLTDTDRAFNSIYFGSRTTGETQDSDLYVYDIKLYYKPITIVLKSLLGDEDARITPQIWTSGTSHEDKDDQSTFVGGLSFANEDPTVDSKAFFDGDTVQLSPQWEPQLDTSKIYLWGYKIERKGGLAGPRYYEVKGDTLNIRDIYTGKMRDVDGREIPRDEVLMDGDQIVMLPIYRAKNAFVTINFDDTKGGMDQNSFANGETLKIGMLDTVKFNAFANTGYFVSGYEHGDMNKDFKGITTYSDERYLETVDADEARGIIENNLANLRPITGININPALPNELDFKPQKTYSNLTVQYSTPELKAMVDPRSSNKDQGSIAYFPGEGEEIGEPEDYVGNHEKPLVISPIERNKLYTISGLPEEGYGMVWKDWSGDVNEDGILSEEEKNNIAEYEHLFNRIHVNGSFFNYVPQYDKPLIYYSFVPRTEHDYPGLVTGRVVLKGGNITDGTSGQGGEKPLQGIEIIINGFKVTTDDRGNFELENHYFATNEYHTLIIDYKGIKYTGHILTNNWTKIVIEEYDSFRPYNFKIFEERPEGIREVAPESMVNKDANFKFRFDIQNLKPGISAAKALIRVYSKEGMQRGETMEVTPASGSFSFDFNPASHNVVPGDTMTVQFVDQNGLTYLEHQVGFSFKKYLDTFSLLSSFKSPASDVIDMVGAIDVAFDLGLAGKTDDYIEKNNEEWIISFGFSREWKKSLGGGSPAGELKDAAKSTDPDKAKDTTDEAINKGNKEKKKAKVTADMSFDLSTALYLRMTVDTDPESDGYGDAYFNEMIMSATVVGEFGTKVEVTTPIGVSVFVALELKGELTAMMVIEQYDYKRFYFNEQGEIDFSNAGVSNPDRDFTIYGKFIIKPSIAITVGANIPMATFSITGRALFDMNFTTTGSGSGNVTLTLEMSLTVLFFDFNWDIAQKTWDLFEYGQMSTFNAHTLFGDTNYLYDSAENYELLSREYLQNRGGWQGGGNPGGIGLMAVGEHAENEQVLQTGVYPYPNTLLAPIGENRQLLIFLDDDPAQDDRNRAQLYYSINDGTSWSQPEKVDDDNTPDDNPWLYDMGDKVLVAWSSAVSRVEESHSAMEVLNRRNIKARFFHKDSQTFGEVQNVTYETEQDVFSDTDPYIAYWKNEVTGKENLMLVYTKTEFKSTASDDDQDAVVGDIVNAYSVLAYRFYDFESNRWDESGDLGDGFYGQGFLDVSEYVAVDESALLITEEDEDYEQWAGYWSREPEINEISIEELSSDPLIAESNAIGYEDWAVLAYSIDMDQNIATTEDRELFIQMYSFTENTFYPALHFEDTMGQSNLEFVQANNNVYLYFISDGDIVSIDIGALFNGGLRRVLHYELDGEDVFVLNKTKEFYRKPVTIVKHPYDTRKDQAGNEYRINEKPVEEFMIKADENNVYLVWGENDITYLDGVDPNSVEAAQAENYYRERHVYAARKILGKVTEQTLMDEEGNPMLYPAQDPEGNDIDYDVIPDINGGVREVKAGDHIIVRSRETQWSDPVKLTDEQGANFNDLDFVILPDGSLRVAFVKGKSEVKNIAGEQMSAENISNRTLMTADFSANKKRASVEIQPTKMPLPNELMPVEVRISNLGLSPLNDLNIELNQITGTVTEMITEEPIMLNLRGGETKNLLTNWQAPHNPVDTKLQVVIKDDTDILCSNEQVITAESALDVVEARAEFIDRNNLQITGSVVNNGNISSDEGQISAIVSTQVVGMENLGSVDVGDTKRFAFHAKINQDMLETTVNDDGSVTEAVQLNIHAGSMGIRISCERYARKHEIDIINNISAFELITDSQHISGSVSLLQGRTMNILPELSYEDESMPSPRLVFVSSDEEVADFSQGHMTLLGKKTGTATITAYALPPKSEMILAENRMERLDNFARLSQAAVKTESFTLNVVSSDDEDYIVSIPDNGLEEAIREAIDKPEGDITKADMEGINILSAYNRRIIDLTGLEYAINIEELNLSQNQISDISALENLENLQLLEIENNYLDISAGSEAMELIQQFIDHYVDVQYEPQRVLDECFIATAAFGSRLDPAVTLLRHFRDTKLLTNGPGQAFVGFYYSVSPPIAEFITDNSMLKVLVRIMLIPIIAAAYLALHSWLLLIALLSLSIALLIKRKHMRPLILTNRLRGTGL